MRRAWWPNLFMAREAGYRDKPRPEEADLDTVILERTTDPNRAGLLRGLLESEGIVVSTPGYTASSTAGITGVFDIVIRVPKKDPSGRSGVWCTAERGRRITCRGGLRCTTTGLTPISCVGDGAACSADTCADTTLTECDSASARSRPPVDSADVGGTCDVTMGCVPSATECTPGESTCDGSIITYCSPGRTRETLDCTALGFSRCLAATGTGVFCL